MKKRKLLDRLTNNPKGATFDDIRTLLRTKDSNSRALRAVITSSKNQESPSLSLFMQTV
jgi:hypothetical protein